MKNEKKRPNDSVITYEYNTDSQLIACHLPQDISWKASYDDKGRKITEGLYI